MKKIILSILPVCFASSIAGVGGNATARTSYAFEQLTDTQNESAETSGTGYSARTSFSAGIIRYIGNFFQDCEISISPKATSTINITTGLKIESAVHSDVLKVTGLGAYSHGFEYGTPPNGGITSFDGSGREYKYDMGRDTSDDINKRMSKTIKNHYIYTIWRLHNVEVGSRLVATLSNNIGINIYAKDVHNEYLVDIG